MHVQQVIVHMFQDLSFMKYVCLSLSLYWSVTGHQFPRTHLPSAIC